MALLRFATLFLIAATANAVGTTTGGMDGGLVTCALGSVQDRAGTPSSTCMTCHDGSQAADARTGHRYDIDYTSAFDPNLRPNPQQFNAAIVLSNGKVTCLTCHDPASKLDFHLAGPLDGPAARRMCVACHPKE
jgi:hypothetical protein